MTKEYMPNGVMNNFEWFTNDQLTHKWFFLGQDRETLYGFTGSQLYKSSDGWATQTLVGDTGVNTGMGITFAFELKNGSLIFATRVDGGVPDSTSGDYSDIYVSDPNDKTNVTKVLTTEGGYCSANYGHSHYDNVIFISTYGPYGEARFAYLSIDYGQSFTKVFDFPEVDMTYNRFHIHDCEYDPWTGALWLVAGDSPVGSRYFVSYDLGANWHKIGKEILYQDTGVLALPDKILFAPDDMDAIRVIHKDMSHPKKKYRETDVENLCFADIEKTTFSISHWSCKNKNSHVERYEKPYNLTMNHRNGVVNTIMASGDSKNWYDVANCQALLGVGLSDMQPQSMIGPDINGKVYGLFYSAEGNRISPTDSVIYFKADFPKWVEK